MWFLPLFLTFTNVQDEAIWQICFNYFMLVMNWPLQRETGHGELSCFYLWAGCFWGTEEPEGTTSLSMDGFLQANDINGMHVLVHACVQWVYIMFISGLRSDEKLGMGNTTLVEWQVKIFSTRETMAELLFHVFQENRSPTVFMPSSSVVVCSASFKLWPLTCFHMLW